MHYSPCIVFWNRDVSENLHVHLVKWYFLFSQKALIKSASYTQNGAQCLAHSKMSVNKWIHMWKGKTNIYFLVRVICLPLLPKLVMFILGSLWGLISWTQSPWQPHRDTVTCEPAWGDRHFPSCFHTHSAPQPSPQEQEKFPGTKLKFSAGFHRVHAASHLWHVEFLSRAGLFLQEHLCSQKVRDGTEQPQCSQMLS